MTVVSTIAQDTAIMMTHKPILVQVMGFLRDFKTYIKKNTAKKSKLLSDEMYFSHRIAVRITKMYLYTPMYESA